MALGILEPAHTERTPGTININEEAQRAAELLRNAPHLNLKATKDGKKILVPQPSDDLKDPLNWPRWKRDVILAVLSFVSVVATTASPLLAADSTTIAILFSTTFEKAALLTAYHLAGVAVGGVIFVPFARVWGKRYLFLFGALLMVASSAWGGATKHGYNYTSLLWARVFQGVALAPFEGLLNTCVGDLYFVHERGLRMAFTNTCLFGGAFLTPVFVGQIANNGNLGWQWSFYFIAIFMAAGFVLLVFFVPETAYRRADSLDLDLIGDDMTALSSATSSAAGMLMDEKTPQQTTAVHESRTTPSHTTFAQRFRSFEWRMFFKLLLRPFPLFLHPAIAWGCLVQGVIIGWTVMVGVILSLIFLGPPLFFGVQRAGNMYTGAFIGSMLGLLLSGLYTETVTNFMIRRNKGVYEPEFRILLTIPMLIFAAAGFYGFAITAANTYKYGWLVPEVFLAFIIISMVMGAVASAQYLIDAHRDLAVEAFTCLLIFKNIFSFLLAYFAYNWVFAGGIRNIFIAFGSIEMFLILLSIPMYVLGKRSRAWTHKHDILKMARLR